MTRLNRVDREALALAIKLMHGESRACAEQLDAKLEREPWDEVGAFASYHCQMRSLGLRPWQSPPCWIDSDDIRSALREPRDDQRGVRAAAELLQRMRSLGISKYHPTPVEAVAEAERGTSGLVA